MISVCFTHLKGNIVYTILTFYSPSFNDPTVHEPPNQFRGDIQCSVLIPWNLGKNVFG